MTDAVAFEQQNMVGGGSSEVMEVMMTGGDGSAMNEDTLAQVVNMLQMEGQLSGGNHTIIIRQPNSDEIQMIQTTSNGGELVVTKASAEEIQALQAGNVDADADQEILENQQGQVVMMDESGNLVEGMVQMQDSEDQPAEGVAGVHMNENGEISNEGSNPEQLSKSSDVTQQNEILSGFVSMAGVDQNLLSSDIQSPDPPITKSETPVTISMSTNTKRPIVSPPSNKVVSIKINTGVEKRKETKRVFKEPSDVIKISTVTGRQKSQPPKFHKCENCTINFVSKVAYMNHMENCPSKKKPVTPISNKGNIITYTCVFCENKFNSRLILMQHVRTCDKSKATKNQSLSKPRTTTAESKLKLIGGPPPKTLKTISSPLKRTKKGFIQSEKLFKKSDSLSLLDPEDEEDIDRDLESEDDDERGIVYDDEEDINEEDLVDEDIEDTLVNKRSQKHLGPIITKGMYKCRDCSRTFSKEYQYNRHVKACTNAPLNASRIVNDLGESPNGPTPSENDTSMLGMKRKRGRPIKDFMDDGGSPKKRKPNSPKIISIDPKKVVSSSILPKNFGKRKFTNFSDGESGDESDFLGTSFFRNDDSIEGSLGLKKKSNKVSLKRSLQKQGSKFSTGSSVSKIVKISPSDTLIKKTGKAILSKLNQQKAKFMKDNPFCGLCGDKFKTNSELGIHTQVIHSEDLLHIRDSLDGKGNLASVKCPLCDCYFVSSHMLLFHMVSYHSKELKSVNEELETLNLNLLCPFCNLTCPSQDLFKEHLATMHLDKLINKPTASILPTVIDIHALIKEKNNGSILPTAKLLSKQEKVLCPDCGLFLMKSYFEHHRCAAESHSPSARKFICSEAQCGGMTFYKLIHLLTHLHQVHDKNLPCESHSFESSTQFMEWLKKEEGKTKMKYTKALQRMKQGKLNTVWICHRFHSAMKDASLGSKEDSKKADRHCQCYSRIHSEISFSSSTTRYDGKTVIKYYPEHKHQEPLSPKKPDSPVVRKTSAPPAEPDATTYSDAAELKQLLEDDCETSRMDTGDAVQEDEELPTEAEEKEAEADKPQEITKPDDDKICEESLTSSDVSETKTADDDVATSESKIEDDSNLVSFSDADLPALLDKMLGDHDAALEDGEPLSVDNNAKDTVVVDEPKPLEEGGTLPSTESKISEDVDMLEEAFGASAEDSSTSTASNTQQSSTSSTSSSSTQPQQQQRQEDPKEDQEEEEETKSSEMEDNTYVLPADMEEWKKLFELVHSQVDSKSLSGEELTNAKQLLTYEDQITDISIEKQVEVFNRLCSLANVQMT